MVLSQRNSARVAGGPYTLEASVWAILLAQWCYKHVLNCLTCRSTCPRDLQRPQVTSAHRKHQG